MNLNEDEPGPISSYQHPNAAVLEENPFHIQK